ncbi:MAG: hypothetical protein V4760_00985 [Bdellovibrionota bacterium]
MKLVVAALLGLTFAHSTAFAQFTCSEDPECQQGKIEAMSLSTLKTVKEEARSLRLVFLKGATESSEDGEYRGYARGLNAMDEYLARLSAIEKAPTAANLDEVFKIRDEVASVRRAYTESLR